MLEGRRCVSISARPERFSRRVGALTSPLNPQIPLSPLLPLHPGHSPASPFPPTLTQKGGGCPLHCSDQVSLLGARRFISELIRGGFPCQLFVFVDQQQREAVLAFASYDFHRGGADGRLARRHFQEAATALNVGVVAVRVDDFAAAHYVVGKYQATAPRELQRPLKVLRHLRFVGVDEDQIERRQVL